MITILLVLALIAFLVAAVGLYNRISWGWVGMAILTLSFILGSRPL